MLRAYLNQAAVWTPAQRDAEGSAIVDAYARIQYAEPQTIRCRREAVSKEIITADKRTVRISNIYYLTAEVKVGDLLDGKSVEDVQDWPGLSGRIIGYEAVV